jgi:hypothetical protein
MTAHTHRLARPYSHIVKGKRVEGEVGDAITPTKSQLQNQPDCFVAADGSGVKAPTNVSGVKGLAASAVKEYVAKIDDLALLNAMLEEEQAGRERVTATRAIQARLDELIDEGEDGKGGDEG